MRYFRTLILSLGIHLGLGVLLWYLAPKTPPPSVRRAHLDVIDLLEKPEPRRRPVQLPKDQKQFTRATEIPEELLSKQKREARFSSEQEQYVLEEIQSRHSGLTANRTNRQSEGAKPQAAQDKKERVIGKEQKAPGRGTATAKADRSLNIDDMDLRPGDILVSNDQQGEDDGTASDGSRPLQLPSLGKTDYGVSTTGEQLPDSIKFGDFTALNTDRHLYYTFYARMEEQLRYRWESYARAIILSQRLPARSPRGNSWNTRIEVLLDKHGNFVKAILHESSGSQALDSAPVQAFRDARQFPNPPEGMVTEDGLIHLYYSFNVNVLSRLAGAE